MSVAPVVGRLLVRRRAAQLLTRSASRVARRRTVTAGLCLAVLTVFAIAMVLGEARLSPGEVLASLAGQGTSATDFVVHELRLPRAVTAVVVGAAFGLSGAILQALVRNPLASPDIIGITSGASAAAVTAIVVFGAGGLVVSGSALAGGTVAALLIYLLAWRSGVSGGRMVLVGIALAAMLQAVVTFLMTRANVFVAEDALVWLTGSLNGATRDQLPVLLMTVGVLVVALALTRRTLDPLWLSDESATGLGVRVHRSRLGLTMLAVGLAATATATTGPIAFVAFVSAPIARRLVGGASSALVPSALVGMLVTTAADLVAQHATGTTFPVGVVTGLVGGPYLIYVLVAANRRI